MHKVAIGLLLVTALSGCSSVADATETAADPLLRNAALPAGYALIPVDDPFFDGDYAAQWGMTSNPGPADMSWRDSWVAAGGEAAELAVYEKGDVVVLTGILTFPDQQTASKWLYQQTTCTNAVEAILQLRDQVLFLEAYDADHPIPKSDGAAFRNAIRDVIASTGATDMCAPSYA